MKFYALSFCFFISLIGLALSFYSCKPTQNKALTSYVFNKSVVASKAVVVSAHPLATRVGIEIMQQGGNAVDAAIAVQLALAVVYPRAGNLGGGGFMLYRDPQGKINALDYRETAPQLAHKDMYLDAAKKIIPNLSLRKHLSVGVPGSPAGMYAAWQAHSALKNWEMLVAPAIQLAQKGFHITDREARMLNINRADFDTCNTQPSVFLKSALWSAGDLLQQKDLAKTLKRLQKEGAQGFYQGETADLIVAEMQRGKGIISHQDLKNYTSEWRQPLKMSYRQHEIYSMPPPSSGGVLLQQCLKMVEPFPLSSYGQHASESVHLMVEAERRAFADRANNLGDPSFWNVPLQKLSDSLHIASLMQSFLPQKATVSASLKEINYNAPESDNTTHLCVVDDLGGAVAVTTTLNDNYGSMVVVGGAGFLLNDEMDDFTSKPGEKNMYGSITGPNNAIVPGKRMLSSMTPTIVTQNNQLLLVVGTPGGTTIPTSVFQTIVNVIDFKQNAAQAVAAPRFHHQLYPDSIIIEPRCLSENTRATLISKGHAFKTRQIIGTVEAILRRPDGWLEGAADPRGDDDAQGF